VPPKGAFVIKTHASSAAISFHSMRKRNCSRFWPQKAHLLCTLWQQCWDYPLYASFPEELASHLMRGETKMIGKSTLLLLLSWERGADTSHPTLPRLSVAVVYSW